MDPYSYTNNDDISFYSDDGTDTNSDADSDASSGFLDYNVGGSEPMRFPSHPGIELSYAINDQMLQDRNEEVQEGSSQPQRHHRTWQEDVEVDHQCSRSHSKKVKLPRAKVGYKIIPDFCRKLVSSKSQFMFVCL